MKLSFICDDKSKTTEIICRKSRKIIKAQKVEIQLSDKITRKFQIKYKKIQFYRIFECKTAEIVETTKRTKKCDLVYLSDSWWHEFDGSGTCYPAVY